MSLVLMRLNAPPWRWWTTDELERDLDVPREHLLAELANLRARGLVTHGLIRGVGSTRGWAITHAGERELGVLGSAEA